MIFDIHGDIWTDVTIRRLRGETQVIRKYHAERFKEGQMIGGTFIVWVDPPHDQNEKKRFEEILRAASAEIIESGDLLSVVRNRAEFDKARSEGKLAIILGMEGLSAIEDNLEWLYPLYLMGFRHCSLTWNEQNALATGVRGDAGRGITKRGKKAVRIIEDLGMLLDASHLNEKSFWDLIDIAQGPVIASHSNAKAICHVPRNLTDEQILAIGKTGGLVGINAVSEFLHEEKGRRNADTFLDHLEHIAGLIGTDKIALGFDFMEYIAFDTTSTFMQDAYEYTAGLEDIRSGPALLNKLRKRGFTKDEVEDIAYRNMIRLLDKVAK